jgi:NADH-ubiquinone oxidoreductase chain 4
MILLLLLLIPLIGAIIISMIPVSELSEQEAKNIVENKIEAEIANMTLTTEEISLKINQGVETLLKQENYKRSRLVQIVGLSFTLITFLISIYMWVLFDSSVNQYQFVYNFDSISFCHFYIGIDGISLYFVLLTTFLTPIAILANLGSLSNNIKYFIISFFVLETLQIALFVVLDLLLFYIFFESILPILFLVIIIYGTGEDRVRSSFLFFLYTLAGSLFMLLAILQIYNYVGSTDFQLLSLSEISLESQIILWAAFFLALATKTPLIPVHMWLPRAHTSAPLGGSILLAGTVLKFATYGMLRLLIHLFPDASNYCSVVVQVIAIITLIFASLATILQQDTKTLIAYSSICHMAVVVLGIFSNSFIGIIGAILLGIAHGFVSPALFLSVGGVMYERYHKRNIGYYKGLSLTMPVFITMFFIFILANTGIPLTLNFLGEQLSLMGMWERNPIITVLGATSIVLSACYSIWMYNRIAYGSFSPYLTPMPDLSRKEFNLLVALLLPTVLFGIFPSIIIETLDIPTTTLLYIS